MSKQFKDLEVNDVIYNYSTSTGWKETVVGNVTPMFNGKVIINNFLTMPDNESVFSRKVEKDIFNLEYIYWGTSKEEIIDTFNHDQDVLYCGIKNYKKKIEE